MRHNPEVQQALHSYQLGLSRLPMAGLTGELLGRGTGSSLEFQEYREYMPGDDIRHLDWAAYGRTDSLMIRLYREEISPRTEILLDASRSMTTGGETKSLLARQLTALFALLSAGLGGRPSILPLDDARPLQTLGVEGIEPATMRKANIMLIPRNTPLPATFTETFTTKRFGQTSIVVRVLEGESPSPGDCATIGRTVIRDLPRDLPKGCPIQVTFAYGTNGRLAVHTVLPGRKRSASVEIERESGLSSQGVARWKQVVSPSVSSASGSPTPLSAGFDAFQSLVNEALGLASDAGSDTMPENGSESEAEGSNVSEELSAVAYHPPDTGPPPVPPPVRGPHRDRILRPGFPWPRTSASPRPPGPPGRARPGTRCRSCAAR